MAKKVGNYDEHSIEIYEGLAAVKKRPAMYIGDVSTDGYHHLIKEALDNSVDEAVAGFANNIDVIIHDDGSVQVDDDGRGIPVKNHPIKKIPTIDVVMTMLHAGGKFGGEGSAFRTSGGLHGVGISAVNALSTWLEVTVKRDGREYFRRYEAGIPTQKALKVVSRTLKKKDTGTSVRFLPDTKNFFKTCKDFDKKRIARRLRQLSFLNSGLRLTLKYKDDDIQNFYSHHGLIDYVKHLTAEKKTVIEPILISTKEGEEVEGCSIELAFMYDDKYDNAIHSFANNINTVEGGVHYNAALDSLSKVMEDIARSSGFLKKTNLRLNKSDVIEGLTLAVSVRVQEPQFGGQTKTKLVNEELRTPLGEWFTEKITKELKKNRQAAKAIAEKIVDAMRARDAARKAKNITRKKSSIDSLILPGRLADCSSKDPSLCEIFIVEGESAAGGAKDARDRHTQAILPLKGKPLNVMEKTLNKALENDEIAAIISALGIDVTARDCQIENLRYHKVVILTDADVDGSHIDCLLKTLFYKFMPNLIKEGHLYVCELPLYRAVVRNKSYYLKDEDALDKFNEKNKGAKIAVTRFKGLGEMNPDQLAETAFQNTRKLNRIHIDDEADALEMLQVLMGDDAKIRKQFIEEHLEFIDD